MPEKQGAPANSRRSLGVRGETLSYIHGASDVPLLGEPIFQNLRRTAARFGDREALVVREEELAHFSG